MRTDKLVSRMTFRCPRCECQINAPLLDSRADTVAITCHCGAETAWGIDGEFLVRITIDEEMQAEKWKSLGHMWRN
jgi:hypothetical protein